MTITTARALALAMLVSTLGACAVGPDFERPATVPADTRFTQNEPGATASAAVYAGAAQHFNAGVAVDQRWWESFASPALSQLIDAAFKHNPTIDAAQASMRQARENVAAQVGFYFPTVQAAYSPSRQKNAVGTISPTLSSGEALYTLHTAQLSVGYAPDVFGLNRRTVESLEAQAEAQKFQLEAAYLTLASSLTGAVIQQAALEAQIDATRSIIKASERSLNLLRRQAELGFASGLDLAGQESAVAQARQALPPLVKQLEQTRDLIAVLTGEFPDRAGLAHFDLSALQLPTEIPLGLPSGLVQRRPDIRAAEAQVHSASAQVGVALANRLPQFSISALYGGTSTRFDSMFSNGNRFWGLAGNVGQTIFDFGTLKHRQRGAEAALDQASAQYRSVVLTAFQNVADSLHALDADADSLVAASKAEAAARRTLDLTQKQLELGSVNALALLSAEQAFQQATIARIQAQAVRYLDTVALFQSLGGAWSKESDTVMAGE